MGLFLVFGGTMAHECGRVLSVSGLAARSRGTFGRFGAFFFFFFFFPLRFCHGCSRRGACGAFLPLVPFENWEEHSKFGRWVWFGLVWFSGCLWFCGFVVVVVAAAAASLRSFVFSRLRWIPPNTRKLYRVQKQLSFEN
ncbi:hypothetical protein IWX46DRAFT_249809 [Phyllosticta citricarpa]|uniref:Transmembrane protein n=1 Tax=Phyllosticta citricarpa TaxID=55181 RepID=A0ABR1LRG4_9PEZI